MDKTADSTNGNGADDTGADSIPEIRYETDQVGHAEPVHDPVAEDIPEQISAAEIAKLFPSGTHWCLINGCVGISSHLADAALRAADRAGLSDVQAQNVSNMLARNLRPEYPDVACGVIFKGEPHIFHTNIDRNEVMDEVRPFLNEAARRKIHDLRQVDTTAPAYQNVKLPELPKVRPNTNPNSTLAKIRTAAAKQQWERQGDGIILVGCKGCEADGTHLNTHYFTNPKLLAFFQSRSRRHAGVKPQLTAAERQEFVECVMRMHTDRLEHCDYRAAKAYTRIRDWF